MGQHLHLTFVTDTVNGVRSIGGQFCYLETFQNEPEDQICQMQTKKEKERKRERDKQTDKDTEKRERDKERERERER